MRTILLPTVIPSEYSSKSLFLYSLGWNCLKSQFGANVDDSMGRGGGWGWFRKLGIPRE